MIWLVLAACAMCLLVGLRLGVGLAHAAARGDDRRGMVDLTGFKLDIPKIDPTVAVADPTGERAKLGRRIDIEFRGQGPGDQSAA